MKVNLGVESATYDNGEKLNDVMKYNHFGTETIPPRPVLRIGAEGYLKSSAFNTALGAYLKNVITYTKAGRTEDLKKAERELCRKMGVGSVTEAKRIIQSGRGLQHNAPLTVAKKGSDKPLFDTGLMLSKINYQIEE